jgi:hypothetical protein
MRLLILISLPRSISIQELGTALLKRRKKEKKEEGRDMKR